MSFGAFQKPDVGFGPGVKPSQTIGSVSNPSGLHPSIESGYGMNPILATGDDVFYPIYESTGGNLPFNAGTVMDVETPYVIDPGVPQLGYDPIYGTETKSTRVLSPNIESLAEKTDVLSDKNLAELENNYKILEQQRQDKMNKMMELATMGDDTPQTSIRPQMVGAGSGMRNFQPIASGPLKRPDDILNTPFLQRLYS
jgi:hypothetical protein